MFSGALAMACRCVLAALTAALFLTFPARAADAAAPPNVVLILADDLGWADLGCYGSRYHKTPHLDRLASQGVRFTDAYAAAPVCSPTRAAIMTGKYPARLNLTDWLPGRPDRPDQKLRRPKISQELPETRIQDSSDLTASLRMVKSPAELELMRAASRISDQAMAAGLEPIGTLPSPGSSALVVGWLHPRTCLGMLIEVWNRPPGPGHSLSQTAGGSSDPRSRCITGGAPPRVQT